MGILILQIQKFAPMSDNPGIKSWKIEIFEFSQYPKSIQGGEISKSAVFIAQILASDFSELTSPEN